MPVCARLLVLLGLLLATIPSQICRALDSGNTPGLEVVPKELPDPDSDQNKLDALVILGLANSLHQDVRNAIQSRLTQLQVVYAEIDELENPNYQWPDVDKIIATGAAGCEQAVSIQVGIPIVCTFLTAERFREIVQKQSDRQHKGLMAIIIDQPLYRQAAVASKVYPALSSFAVLSQQEGTLARSVNDDIRVLTYRSTRALAPQLTEVTTSLDALIATPESAIYNRSTLRTVLLTAYGYGKPVVGYSRAYVKAGALITGYSTPDQVFRQIAEMTDSHSDSRSAGSAMVSPKYFSVVDNPSVAKSLGLFKMFEFSVGKSYQDKDFQS